MAKMLVRVFLALVCAAQLASAAEPRGPSCPAPQARVLVAGDSWAQFMWDDDAHNAIFDRFGHGDKWMLSRSLDSDPGAGYGGPEYAISGSEARQWADTANYPWIANVLAELDAQPSVDTVVLSIGGNDVLAGRSDGGWYKDMDLDVAGSEAALFETIRQDTFTVIDALQGHGNGPTVLLSSYEYPNFDVNILWCWIYACPKRRDLSRDPDADLITDTELNAMFVDVEAQRLDWTLARQGLEYDNSVGLMHHYYGDGVAGPGELPRPGFLGPLHEPFPGGNPLRPTLRQNFREVAGISADPIHLDPDGYQYKVAQQTQSYFFEHFRRQPAASFFSQGGGNDGWSDGTSVGTGEIRVGDTGAASYAGLVSFDTSSLPDEVVITGASLYLQRAAASGTNPFSSGDLGAARVDVQGGSFGAPEVEAADATAVADAENAGCFVGSVAEDFYALRVDLTADGLAAIDSTGLTQFRVSFPQLDPGVDRVDLYTGDGQLLRGADRLRTTVRTVEELRPDGTVEQRQVLVRSIVHQGLGEILGTPAPMLDVYFDQAPFTIFVDGFETGDAEAWTAVAD